MALADYFKQTDTMMADEVRAFLQDHRPDDYNLVDVRQPKEYEQAHLPGALLIPLGDIPDGLGALDPKKPTIVY